MLRASADAASVSIDLTSVAQRTRSAGREDADALLAFTDALVGRTTNLSAARETLATVIGSEAVVPASASAGNFEMMNRILDGAGIPVSASMKSSIGPMIGLTS